MKIEIAGETHTFCNVLQKALLDDAGVDMAGYEIAHPLVANPTIYVRTKGKRKPKAALKDAAKMIQIQNKEFKKSFEKALKNWEKT